MRRWKSLLVLLLLLLLTTSISFADASTEGSINNREQIQLLKADDEHVYFGNYPQTEVVSGIEQCGTYGRDWWKASDCIIDPDLYEALEGAEWNNNDAIIGDNKYHRLRRNDINYSTTGWFGGSDNYYVWDDNSKYHYFKYEPIKWKILSLNDNEAFLFCDTAIDSQPYNSIYKSGITWETSSIREWLNNNFLNAAFNRTEKNAIKESLLTNSLNGSQSDAADTVDKVFLLSFEDVVGTQAKQYGFNATYYSDKDTTKRLQCTTFGKASGAYIVTSGRCRWWLRTLSTKYNSSAQGVIESGYTSIEGTNINHIDVAVCPAIHLKIKNEEGKIFLNDECNDMVLSNNEFIYDGNEKKPIVTIGTLEEGTDYQLEYFNCVNPGIATVKAEGIGDYEGTLTKTYRIGYALPDTIELAENIFTYDGTAKCPTVNISGLIEGEDYLVEYDNNIASGTATVTAIGIGQYIGKVSTSFAIEKLNISSKEIILDQSHFVYLGEKLEPTFSVDGLELGNDYIVMYDNNESIGLGSITVAGIGSCMGSKTVQFEIHEMERVDEKEETCLTNGNNEYWVCSCGKYYSDANGTNEIEENSWIRQATGHMYADWIVTSEATCTEKGQKEKVCTVCGEKVTEAIPANGHAFAETFTVDTEPTCTVEGSKSKHCANCDEVADVTAIAAKGHSWNDDYTIDKEASCTEEGSKSIHCATCGITDETTVTDIPAKGHSFGDWVEVTPSDCENSGLKQHTCESCGLVESENLDPKGHEWESDFTVDVEATCTTDGNYP